MSPKESMVSISQAGWFGVALNLFLPSWILGPLRCTGVAQELRLSSWLEHYYLSPASWIRQPALQSEESSGLTWSPLRTGMHSQSSRQVEPYWSRSYTEPIAVEQLFCEKSWPKAGRGGGQRYHIRFRKSWTSSLSRNSPGNTAVLKRALPLQ